MTAAAETRAKGPLVFGDMDQQALDDAYDQQVWASNLAQLTARRAMLSDLARARLGAPQRFAYGPTPIEALDVFTTAAPGAPVAMFIHGGAWRVGAAKDNAFLAENFVRAGAHLAIPDFASVNDTGGELMPLVDQLRRAVAWLHGNAARFGGDPGRLYLFGHSSGAHLGGNVLVTDWEGAFGLPRDLLKGGLLCSGMYDLAPVRLSKRSAYVNFTDAVEHDLSAQRHIARLDCPLVLAYGSLETPEFQRQSRDFAAAVKAAGKPVELIRAEHYNHFEIIETLASPYGILGRAALSLMGLA